MQGQERIQRHGHTDDKLGQMGIYSAVTMGFLFNVVPTCNMRGLRPTLQGVISELNDNVVKI